MTVAAIKITNLVKSYKQLAVLRNVSLEVHEGEFVGLIGVNGAGKTTLFKTLLNLSQDHSGSIEIFGIDSHNVASRSRLAFLPEQFRPPYYLTGKRFLRYMLELYQVSYTDEGARQMFADLDLDDAALSKPVRSYSKGMTQKLGLAACFLSQRELYLLDEPMSGLDPKGRALLKNRLRYLKQSARTLIFSSHILSDVEELCNRVAILHDGVLAFLGSPTQCCEHYAANNLEQAYLRCIGAPVVSI